MPKRNQELRITAFPRLHLTLIGMNEKCYRINGGIGFAINDPQLNLRINPSGFFQLIDTRDTQLSQYQYDALSQNIEKARSQNLFKNNITVEISGEMGTHYGFGSETLIRLSCLEALFILNDCKYDPKLLISLSGRGGTSGIGIHTYFEGGMILDIGRKHEGGPFNPSSYAENRKKVPLLLKRTPMPKWNIGLCIPSEIPSKSVSEEKEFFDKTCPIEITQVYETLYHAVFGLNAAIEENDKLTFCKALKNIQNCAWKHAERKQYGVELSCLENNLYNCGAMAVGMSSLGPSLFFIADDIPSVINKMQNNTSKYKLINTYSINRGRIVKYV